MKLFTKNNGITINFSTDAVLRTIILVIIAIFFLRFIGKIGHQLELFGISAFLAIALNPAVSAISRHLKIKKRIWATGLAYILVMGLLIGFVLLVVPPLAHQTNVFIKSVPNTVSNLKNADSAPGRLVQRYNLQKQVDKISSDLNARIGDVPTIVISTASRVGSAFITTVTIIVLTFMMLVEGPLWFERLFSAMPEVRRKPYRQLVNKMYKVVTAYVNGQVLIAAIAALFSFTVLTIASHFTHSPVNAAALSSIVFLFGLIPLIGNTIAAVIVVIICLFSSVPLAIIMAVYFPIYQQTENATLQPHIQAKNNQLTPLIVFMAALIGAGYAGLLGAFIAIPAAGCLRIFLEYKFGGTLMPTEDTVINAKEQ
ncbi:MAG: AI-2E family transporter [Candidatus Saccharibacteria bacterium]